MSNKNDENNRILLATILSTILIVVWMRWYGGRTLPKMEEEKIIKINKEGEVKTKEEKVSEVVEYPTMEEEKYEDKRIKIDTKTLHGTINLRGLVFDDLILKKYKKSIEGGENYNLLNGRNDNDAYYVNVGWDGKDIDIPDKNTLWVADKDTLRSNEPLTFTYNSEGGVLYKVIIEVDDNYMFKITQTVQNKSENVLSIKSKNSISKKQQRGTDDVGVHSGFIGVIDKQIEELEYNKLGKNVVVFDNGNHWSGWTDKYWLVSFVSNFEYRVYKDDDMLFIVDFVDNNTDVAPDTEYATSSYLYAGAKDLNLLDSYADKFDILYFDKAVDFG
ncbi:MAG: membrane protein insertase YidC, partial [Rickettsiales bacterium]|nr:membrane protein insertase YidC [Rickettsiales bacterium]